MKTCLITSCSSGFDQRLVHVAAQRGNQVMEAARNVTTIEKIDAWRDITIATDFDHRCATAANSV